MSLTDAERMGYAVAEPEERYRIAATAQTKLPVIRRVLDRHPGEPTLVIGAYLDQLEELGDRVGRAGDPGVHHATRRTGDGSTTPSAPARSGRWCVSKVANFSIDLPGRHGRRPGVGHVRVPPGGGAAARPGAAAQGRRPAGALLHDR